MGERGRGFTFVELMLGLALLGIVLGLAAPSLHATLARMRVQAALNAVTVDLHFTRMLAIRSGRSAALRFGGAAEGCVARSGPGAVSQEWSVVVLPDDRVARTGTSRIHHGRVCVETNNSAVVTFNSRGLLVPYANRTIHAYLGQTRDSLTVSVVGRVFRRF
jgi:prepilin-type N-terminal cleavage/methylation domain-containing protein